MKVFVTGVCRQLGHDVVNNAVARGYEAVGLISSPSIQVLLTEAQLLPALMFSLISLTEMLFWLQSKR